MLHEVSFKSFNERDMVQGWIYVPACEPWSMASANTPEDTFT